MNTLFTCSLRRLATALAGAAVIICALPAAGAGQDAGDAKAAFQSLYGAKLRDVNGTLDKSDDLALAQQMLEAAKVAAGTPELVTLLCDSAFQLGLRDRGGYATALAAMELLITQRPDLKLDAMQRIVQVRQQEFNQSRGAERAAAGESLVSAITALSQARLETAAYGPAMEDLRRALVIARQAGSSQADQLKDQLRLVNYEFQLSRQVEGLRTRLLRDRSDHAAAEELIALLVREMNDPAKAAEYTSLHRDASWQRHVSLAMKETKDLDSAQALALGQWYRQQAQEASEPAKPALLKRAADNFRQYLSLHTAQDLERTKAVLELKQLEDKLTAAEAPAQAQSPTKSAKPADGLTTTGATFRSVLYEDLKFVGSLAVGLEGRGLLTASLPEGTLRMWDLSKGKELALLSDEGKWFSACQFSPKGDLVAAADLHHEVHLWSVQPVKLIATLKKHTGHVYAATFSPDGRELASAGEDRTIHLWDPATGKWRRQLDGHTQRVRALAYAPDGTLASAGDDRAIHLWRGAAAEPAATLTGHNGPIYALAFSPDGSTLASVDNHGAVIIWDIAKGQLKHKMDTGIALRAVAFSSDGSAVVSAGEDKTVRFWNAASGKAMAALEGHKDKINAVVFTPDGRTMITASNDRTVRLWDVVRQRDAGSQASKR